MKKQGIGSWRATQWCCASTRVVIGEQGSSSMLPECTYITQKRKNLAAIPWNFSAI